MLQPDGMVNHGRSKPGLPWWQTWVLNQVYPRSFADSDGDGIRDLNGITARLQYLAGLVVEGIWISPAYPSPMVDFGYDIIGHAGIDPIFGTLADFDRLIGKAHRLGLRIVLDYVPSRTSDQHSWFRDSRRGRASPPGTPGRRSTGARR